jgi:hypothetical protein
VADLQVAEVIDKAMGTTSEGPDDGDSRHRPTIFHELLLVVG